MGHTDWKAKHIVGDLDLKNRDEHTQHIELGAACGWEQEKASTGVLDRERKTHKRLCIDQLLLPNKPLQNSGA